ncbi:allophanate hydrolase subunit 1 [Streptomyces sp. NPDC091272]|uniref:5-oxoprolinase subunit B family protein n=1 Tax=Streptomyces sp. NPDC091272 TaxID=3365981 RepID=UPI0038113AD3
MRVLPMGAHALLVEMPDLARAQALHAELRRRRAAGQMPSVRALVPAARTVLIDGLDAPQAFAATLRTWHIPPLVADEGPLVEIPVRYDGPDLADVAALWEMPAERVPEVLGGLELRVAFCGFAPGFGYLTGLPTALHLPRRSSPRTAVPAGSVALAGEYAGVYPRSSPGGWQLVGSTDATLWDPRREPAALLAPGTRVRFTEETRTR